VSALGVGAAPAPGISYDTVFQDPGQGRTPDPSLENRAIALIDATPAAARLGFAFRDFNRQPVADALIAAHRRGVQVEGVIDGGERNRPVVRQLLAVLGPDRLVICGAPAFDFHSCIANSEQPSLMHNKFLTFSQLADGRDHVVLQTSKNFFFPSQSTYYNDMVEITGDVGLYEAYAGYLADLRAQQRSDDHYLIRSGDDGRNTFFTSPRRQANPSVDDTIVDRLDEVDCSAGGSIRIAQMAFRTERAVIMRKLAALRRAGCDVEVVVSTADGDIIAGLVSAGVPVHPLLLQARGELREVIVHSKFWLVDAGSTVTGTRTRLTYAGSSTWRGDQQRSDDLLLRIADDGVYAAYDRYWELLRERAVSDPPPPELDELAPSSALAVTPAPNAAGWHGGPVTVRIAASDGHLRTGTSGVARLHVELSGAQTGTWDVPQGTPAAAVLEVPLSTEGRTTVTYWAEDRAGNREAARTADVLLDFTPPRLSGLPDGCTLWPPNHRLVRVADVVASDAGSGLAAGPLVSAWSSAASDAGDIVIDGGSVWLRAEKAERGRARVYTVRATATDIAGNTAVATASCTVRHALRPHGG
jgi:hypothetical protein